MTCDETREIYIATHEGWFVFCPIWYREDTKGVPEPMPKGGCWWLFNLAHVASELANLFREPGFHFQVKPLDEHLVIDTDTTHSRLYGLAFLVLILGLACLLTSCGPARSAVQEYSTHVSGNTFGPFSLTLNGGAAVAEEYSPGVQARASAALLSGDAVTPTAPAPIVLQINIGGIHSETGQTVGAEKTTQLDQVGNPDVQGVPGL